MNAETKAFTSTTSPVGNGFSIRFTLSAEGGIPYIYCEWDPRLPTQDEMRRINIAAYEEARETFLHAISKNVGGPVVCIDAGGGNA